MNSRYRERKYNTSDNDRLLRALAQPVQAWDKKWTQHSNSKTLQTYKWVKSERTIEFEEDEESEEEPEPMETDQPTTEVAQAEQTTEQSYNEPAVTNTNEATTTKKEHPTDGTTTSTTESSTNNNNTAASQTTTTNTVSNSKKSEDSIPGGPSSLLNNKVLSSVQQEDMDEDSESRSQTPKLDDISDEEPDRNMDNDDDDNDVDSISDPSKHPALAPHAQARMTDDDMTDSAAATPQTEGTTPMPQLDDEMEEPQQQQPAAPAHPLSQEILTGIMAQDDIASLNNDSPAIQTPEDTVSVSHPHNPIEDN